MIWHNVLHTGFDFFSIWLILSYSPIVKNNLFAFFNYSSLQNIFQVFFLTSVLAVLLYRPHRMVMSNNLFLGVCTFMSLIVHLKKAKKTFTSTFWLMCAIISELTNSFFGLRVLRHSWPIWIGWFHWERCKTDLFDWAQTWGAWQKTTFLFGHLTLCWPLWFGFHIIYRFWHVFFPCVPQQGHTNTHVLLGPQIFIIIG